MALTKRDDAKAQLKALIKTQRYAENLLKHILLDESVRQKATRLKVTKELFVTDDVFGDPVFGAVVGVVLSAGMNLNLDTFLLMLEPLFLQELLSRDDPKLHNLVAYLYDGAELNPDFCLKTMGEFVFWKRTELIKARNPDMDFAEICQKVAEMALELTNTQSGESITIISPFEKFELPPARFTFRTGFSKIDAVSPGIGPGEYAIIVGHSGGGKTLLACNIAMNNALGISTGRMINGVKEIVQAKVLYISLEEPAVNVATRFYARSLSLNYGKLKENDPDVKAEGEKRFLNLSPEYKELLARNLRIVNMRDLAEKPTAKFIAFWLDKEYKETGYHPDMIVIDQMDFLESSATYDKNWERQEQLTAQIHQDLVKHRIGGEHQIAVWALHQANGKLKPIFTRDEIAGFKGIDRPTDLLIGIGRKDPTSVEVNIFSLKARHSANFCQTYKTRMDRMALDMLETESSVDERQAFIPQDEVPNVELNIKPRLSTD